MKHAVFLLLTGVCATIGFVCLLRPRVVYNWYVKGLEEHRWMTWFLADKREQALSILWYRILGVAALVMAGRMAAEVVRRVFG